MDILGARWAGRNIPIAASPNVCATVSILIKAAILSLKTLIGLHKAPKVERSMPIVTLDGKLNVFVRTDGSSKWSIALEWLIYGENTTDAALVLVN